MSRQAINGPPVMPPLYSLLQAADIVDDGVIWYQGLEWAPEQIGGGAAVALGCGGNATAKPGWHNPMTNTADPFTVYAEDHCSTIGFVSRDYEGRARRQLLSVQSARIAAEFQYGTIAGNAGGGDNASLVEAVEVNGGSGGPPTAETIAVLDGAMADKYDGGRGMIHVATQTLDMLLAEHAIYQAGQKWLTAAGTIVVADAGYGPEGDNVAYAYGTPMVRVRLSPVDVPATFRESIDRATNFVRVYAERIVLVEVDHSDQDDDDLFFKIALPGSPWSAGS